MSRSPSKSSSSRAKRDSQPDTLESMTSPSRSEAVLIHFSGHDAPGQTAALTAILAAHDIRILDIGQAVVHESLALGILVEPGAADFAPIKAALTERALELGLHARFKTVR